MARASDGILGVLPTDEDYEQFKAGAGRYFSGHPGTWESAIPVWGSAREALADLHDGDTAGAIVNGVLAVTDLDLPVSLGRGALKVAGKTAWKTGGHGWTVSRDWMRDVGHVGKTEKGVWKEAHHWAIPQNQWAKGWPRSIVNQPWNIKALPQDIHRRIGGAWGGKPRFNPAQRYWYGTPAWAKRAQAVGVANAGDGAVTATGWRERH